MAVVEIDQEKCIHCGLCGKACILTKFCGFEDFKSAAEDYCIDCGHCVAVCPVGALKHERIHSAEKIGEIPDAESVLNLIKKTRSIRDYKDQKLSDEDIEKLKSVASYCQSGLNAQAVKPLLITDENQLSKIRKSLEKMYDLIEKVYHLPFMKNIIKFILGENNFKSLKLEVETQPQRRKAFAEGRDCALYGAPALMLFICPEKHLNAVDDSTIMAQNMMLTATSMGIGSCYMGLITLGYNMMNFKPLKESLNLPKGYKAFQAMVLGYPMFQYKNMPARKSV